ncbi:hypothetical protein, partial [Pseudomonas savastanoi]|uniref:hypothetical protein n=1 Tax=Pseudomonas savastanoi TaxID=29438 RepID=UPI001969D18F
PAYAAESNSNYWACAQWGSPCSTIFSVFSIRPSNVVGDQLDNLVTNAIRNGICVVSGNNHYETLG